MGYGNGGSFGGPAQAGRVELIGIPAMQGPAVPVRMVEGDLNLLAGQISDLEVCINELAQRLEPITSPSAPSTSSGHGNEKSPMPTSQVSTIVRASTSRLCSISYQVRGLLDRLEV